MVSSRKMFSYFLAIILIFTITIPMISAQNTTAVTRSQLNVRAGAGTEFERVGLLPAESTVILEGRNEDSRWVLVHLPDQSVRGWVTVDYLDLSGSVESLPVTVEQISSPVSAPITPSQPEVPASTQSSAITTSQLNLRNAPDRNGAIVQVLPPDTELLIEGRNQEGDWLFARLPESTASGWVAASYIRLTGIRIADLPITEAAGTQAPEVAQAENVNTPTQITLPPGTVQNVRQIFARGQQAGNHANVVIKIGDSNWAGWEYLCPYQWGSYNLGGYSYLRSSVDFFNRSGSWCAPSQSAVSGFGSGHLLDPSWSNAAKCQNQAPLECEYTLKKPSYALIYIGSIDISFSNAANYERNMRTIIEFLTSHGVVPILSTMTFSDAFLQPWFIDQPPRFNEVIRGLAASYNLPLIDFAALAAPLPDHGVGSDGFHLSYSGGGESYNFTGNENVYGRELQGLVSLMMLHTLRAQIGQ